MKKFVALSLLLGLSASAFAANTCHKYSSHAWGLEKVADKDLSKVTAKYRGFDCTEVSAEEAIDFAQKYYDRLSCLPDGPVSFSDLLDKDSRYEVCHGNYNYYNWVEEDIYVIKNLDKADENIAFAGGWEE